jgi:hypothetical protein
MREDNYQTFFMCAFSWLTGLVACLSNDVTPRDIKDPTQNGTILIPLSYRPVILYTNPSTICDYLYENPQRTREDDGTVESPADWKKCCNFTILASKYETRIFIPFFRSICFLFVQPNVTVLYIIYRTYYYCAILTALWRWSAIISRNLNFRTL